MQDESEQEHMLQILQKYPSLKKFEELGDDCPESHDGREEKLLDFVKGHANIDQMCGNPSQILLAIDEFANQHEFLINIGSDKGRIVAGLIAEEKPRTFVELGGYVGYSAILFADQMRQSRPDEHIHFWSLEFEAAFAKIAEELIALAGLGDVITVVVGPADESLRKLKADSKLDHIDFLFLDHVEDLYEQDFKIAMDELGLLRPSACVVADNVVRPGAPKYREYVRNNERLRSWGVKGLILPGEFEDELEVTKVL